MKLFLFKQNGHNKENLEKENCRENLISQPFW